MLAANMVACPGSNMLLGGKTTHAGLHHYASASVNSTLLLRHGARPSCGLECYRVNTTKSDTRFRKVNNDAIRIAGVGSD